MFFYKLNDASLCIFFFVGGYVLLHDSAHLKHAIPLTVTQNKTLASLFLFARSLARVCVSFLHVSLSLSMPSSWASSQVTVQTDSMEECDLRYADVC
jgi:hypothetical protein